MEKHIVDNVLETNNGREIQVRVHQSLIITLYLYRVNPFSVETLGRLHEKHSLAILYRYQWLNWFP